MVGVRSWSRPTSRLAVVVGLLVLGALLSACAAPTGTGAQGATPQAAPAATSAPAATTAPASTEAPAASAATQAPAAPAPTEAPAAAAATTGVSFSKDVMPIFEKTCIKCHGGSDGVKGGLTLTTYAHMMKGGEDGAVINPGSAAGSMLVKSIQQGKMPKRGQKLPQEQIDLIAKWIDQGAQDN